MTKSTHPDNIKRLCIIFMMPVDVSSLSAKLTSVWFYKDPSFNRTSNKIMRMIFFRVVCP